MLKRRGASLKNGPNGRLLLLYRCSRDWPRNAVSESWRLWLVLCGGWVSFQQAGGLFNWLLRSPSIYRTYIGYWFFTFFPRTYRMPASCRWCWGHNSSSLSARIISISSLLHSNVQLPSLSTYIFASVWFPLQTVKKSTTTCLVTIRWMLAQKQMRLTLASQQRNGGVVPLQSTRTLSAWAFLCKVCC